VVNADSASGVSTRSARSAVASAPRGLRSSCATAAAATWRDRASPDCVAARCVCRTSTTPADRGADDHYDGGRRRYEPASPSRAPAGGNVRKLEIGGLLVVALARCEPGFRGAEVAAAEAEAAVPIRALPLDGAVGEAGMSVAPLEIRLERLDDLGDDLVERRVVTAVIQFSATSSGRRASRSTSARSTCTSRLLCRSAWRVSSPHTCDETKDGDTTTTTAFADSIPASIRARQSALFGMSSRSTHRSLPFAASAATSRWTNSPSRRGRRRTRPAAAAAGPPPVTPPASPPPSSSGGSRRSARVSSRQDPELDESTRRRLC
jgi:hypothetical protein